MSEQISVLAVRQPWANWIVQGFKHLEVRSTHTKKRGEVAIYASRTKPVDSELDLYYKYFQRRLLPIPEVLQGHIIGTANLKESFPVGSFEGFRSLAENHHNPLSYYRDGLYFWQFGNAQKVQPVEFKFNGSIVWSSIDREKIKVI
jgi:hypothetical protein